LNLVTLTSVATRMAFLITNSTSLIEQL
jgi:hypothetical protein